MKILLLILSMFPTITLAELLHEEDFTNFENNVRYSTGFSWGSGVSASIIQDPDVSDNKVLSFKFDGSSDLSEDAFSEQRFDLGNIYSEIWIKYRLFIPNNYYHRQASSSSNAKGYIMLWSGSYSNQNNQAATSWWPISNGSTIMATKWRDEGNNYSEHFFTDSRGVTNPVAIDITKDLGKWQEVVIQVKTADQNQANGIIQVWKNGALLHSQTSIENWGQNAEINGIEKGYILGWANAGFNEETVLLVDDFSVGTTAENIGFTPGKTPNPPSQFNVVSVQY